MTAKDELLEHAEGRKIKCATVTRGDGFNDSCETFNLKIGGDVEAFLNSLDFDYDAGYGLQELFGCVWWEDGTWSDRGEYDGSEWWEHHKTPEIPEELK